MERKRLEKTFERSRTRFVEEWKELLRFPSVSADPAREKDCVACAGWLARHLGAMGFQARLLRPGGKPVVFAEHKGKPGKPVVLFYGHYDVQPVDPVNAWTTPPFSPTFRKGRLYGRGASDNKGQMFYGLKAMETLLRNRALNATVKVILEGEEESSGPSMETLLRDRADLVRADVLMVTDVDAVSLDVPAIVMGLRGIVCLTAVLSGPDHDLHSGVHGGAAPNPAAEMARLIATLHHPDGRIAVKGYYDSVRKPTARERRLAGAGQPGPAAYARETGVLPVGGEKGLTLAERIGFQPTIDINGIHSGYGGAKSKTIIPAQAMVKITSRLVADQDPDRCLAAIVRHLKAHTPRGLKLTIPEKGAGAVAFRGDLDSPGVRMAKAVLDELSGGRTAFRWHGASVPIIPELVRVSGAEPILAGFGLEDDRIHAPNESFSLAQFRLGYLYTGLMLGRL
jgi:acetylornithine deacetylase/succinyl-diaminopimelate desuccinylase-like protein